MAAPTALRPPAPAAGDTTAPSTTHGRPPPVGSTGLSLAAAGVSALVAARPLSDNSFLTHLATGRLLLADGLPATNPFLASRAPDFPVPSWWWSGIVAVAEQVGGLGAVRLLTAVLAGLLGVLVVRLAAPGRGLVAAVLPATLAVLTLLPFLTPRPHLAGFLLLGVALVVWREGRSPWWLVPVLATWVNVHGTWLYGLAVLGLLAAAELVDAPRGDRRRLLGRDVALGGAAVLGVVLGGLLYPEPLRLVGLPVEQLGGGPARQVIQAYNEWQPPGPGSSAFWTLLLLGLAVAGGSLWHRRWGASVASVLLVLVGLSAQRLVPVAAISLLPLAAPALADVGSLRAPGPRVDRVLRAAGAALCAVAAVWVVATPATDLGHYPVAAVDWLEARGLVARPDARLVHEDWVGNYLEHRYGTDANAYVDDRPDLDTALDYLQLIWARPGWRRSLERADARVVLWSDAEPLTRRLARDDGWVRAWRGDGVSVWCRAAVSDRCR